MTLFSIQKKLLISFLLVLYIFFNFPKLLKRLTMISNTQRISNAKNKVYTI